LRNPFGSEIERLEIAGGDNAGEFTLATTPKLAGRWLYELEIQQGGHSRRELIPVLVGENTRPSILLWLARPSFETAALSRWLRQSGAPALVVARLAPDLVREESLNGFTPASGELLDPANRFDLLILDSQLWPSLTSGQKTQLQKLAADGSLLWLVSQDSPQGFLDYARAQQMPLQPLDSAQPVSADGSGAPQLALSGYRPGAVRPADKLLHNSSEPVYWARTEGAKVKGLVLFTQSYPWITAGLQREYAQLWKGIFDFQLAQRGEELPVSLEPQLPLAGQRVSLCSALPVDSAMKITPLNGDANQAPLFARRQGASADESCAEFWPEISGWYRLVSGGQTFEFYVFAADAWPWWQRWIKQADTQRMTAARLGAEPERVAGKQPLRIYWIALLLLSLLSLSWWRERRVY
jgi:hypothetical protein